MEEFEFKEWETVEKFLAKLGFIKNGKYYQNVVLYRLDNCHIILEKKNYMRENFFVKFEIFRIEKFKQNNYSNIESIFFIHNRIDETKQKFVNEVMDLINNELRVVIRKMKIKNLLFES